MSPYAWKAIKIPPAPGAKYPTWRYEVWRGDYLIERSREYPTVLSAGIAAKRLIAEREKNLH